MTGTQNLPKAFILTGAFWAICRNSLYLSKLADENLKALIVTPRSYQKQVKQKQQTLSHLFSEIAYVDGSLDQESSFNPDTIAAVKNWRDRYEIIGAFAVGETLVEPTGIFADILGVKSPGLKATRVCRSKYLQRFCFEHYSPQYQIIPPGKRQEAVLENIHYPIVIKPATRHSSSGVVRMDNAEQARLAIKSYPEHETLLLEQKIKGQEYSVETLSQDGNVIFSSVTHKVTTGVNFV